MEGRKTIATKLAEARTKIGIKKTGSNSFAKYGYYQIDVIYSEAKGVFAELGILTNVRTDIFAVGDKIYQKFYLDVINADRLEEKVTFEAITEPNAMKGAQACQEAGSTITYMSKYLYGLALMIDDGKSDPDANNTHTEKTVIKKSLSRTEIQNRIKELTQDEQGDLMKQYMEKEGRTAPIAVTYWKQDFLNEVARDKGWVS